jgi:hypothetical protein
MDLAVCHFQYLRPYHSIGGSPCVCGEPPETASLNKLITLHTVIIGLPDVVVFLPPAAHQIGSDKYVCPALITSNIVASTEVEQPCLVTVPTCNIAEKVAQKKITQASF